MAGWIATARQLSVHASVGWGSPLRKLASRKPGRPDTRDRVGAQAVQGKRAKIPPLLSPRNGSVR